MPTCRMAQSNARKAERATVRTCGPYGSRMQAARREARLRAVAWATLLGWHCSWATASDQLQCHPSGYACGEPVAEHAACGTRAMACASASASAAAAAAAGRTSGAACSSELCVVPRVRWKTKSWRFRGRERPCVNTKRVLFFRSFRAGECIRILRETVVLARSASVVDFRIAHCGCAQVRCQPQPRQAAAC